jgi:uncharacterized membrane protein
MTKNRIEAFSDGVLAIIVTIMVLELKAPHTDDWSALLELYPKFLSYILSFAMVWIYWNNHHHLFQSIHKVNGRVMLSNGLLLFVLSFQPFATAWMGETHFGNHAVLAMGVVLFISGFSYNVLSNSLIEANGGKDSVLAKSLGRNNKAFISTGAYASAIVIAIWFPLISVVIYILVALLWLIPDKRIERNLK